MHLDRSSHPSGPDRIPVSWAIPRFGLVTSRGNGSHASTRRGDTGVTIHYTALHRPGPLSSTGICGANSSAMLSTSTPYKHVKQICGLLLILLLNSRHRSPVPASCFQVGYRRAYAWVASPSFPDVSLWYRTSSCDKGHHRQAQPLQLPLQLQLQLSQDPAHATTVSPFAIER